jgi:glycosyltransferase involved in cell wall biosynthesis
MKIIFSMPVNPAFHWTAGWNYLLDSMRKSADVVFDPAWDGNDYPVDFPDPLLTHVQSVNMLPFRPHLRSRVRNVAIAVPVEGVLVKRYALNARRNFDHLVTHSQWAAGMMREAGCGPVTVISQMPDYEVYRPNPTPRNDMFTIFSGGKIELRKSHDIIIQAVGYMMAKYPDVRVVADWHNPWQSTMESMRVLPMFAAWPTKTLGAIMRDCGVDTDRFSLMPTATTSVEQHRMDKLNAFWSADVGLFPNRAEACNNSFLIEMMACGCAVIALDAHGQHDVLRLDDPLSLHRTTSFQVPDCGEDVSAWFQPDLDEVIAKLEWAYIRREELPEIGARNAAHLRANFSMAKAAAQYVAVCTEGLG